MSAIHGLEIHLRIPLRGTPQPANKQHNSEHGPDQLHARLISRLSYGPYRVSYIAVVQNDDVCRVEIDPESARSCGEQEDELLRVLRIVLAHARLAILLTRGSVDATVLELPKQAIILENIQRASHLREDQHATVLRLEASQKLVEHAQLA